MTNVEGRNVEWLPSPTANDGLSQPTLFVGEGLGG